MRRNRRSTQYTKLQRLDSYLTFHRSSDPLTLMWRNEKLAEMAIRPPTSGCGIAQARWRASGVCCSICLVSWLTGHRSMVDLTWRFEAQDLRLISCLVGCERSFRRSLTCLSGDRQEIRFSIIEMILVRRATSSRSGVAECGSSLIRRAVAMTRRFPSSEKDTSVSRWRRSRRAADGWELVTIQ